MQTQGSFFVNFRGAISNINQGFGKLLGDVVTDVKDTIYCTVSAVEQVLGLNGFLDKRALYDQKCKGRESPKPPSLNLQDSHSRTVSEIRKHSVIHEKHISKLITHESERSIKTVNKTIIDVSGHIDLKNETSRLFEISKMLTQASENLSKKLQEEIKQLQMNNNNKAPAESIREVVNFLNNSRLNSKNDTEISNIRQILANVTNETHLKINGQQIFDTNLDELKKGLQNLTNENEKLNSTAENQELLGKKQSNYTSISYKDVKEVGKNESTVEKDENIQLEKSEQPKKYPLSSDEDSLASLFNSMPANYDDLTNAKKIVLESQQAEKLLNNLSKGN